MLEDADNIAMTFGRGSGGEVGRSDSMLEFDKPQFQATMKEGSSGGEGFNCLTYTMKEA